MVHEDSGAAMAHRRYARSCAGPSAFPQAGRSADAPGRAAGRAAKRRKKTTIPARSPSAERKAAVDTVRRILAQQRDMVGRERYMMSGERCPGPCRLFNRLPCSFCLRIIENSIRRNIGRWLHGRNQETC